MWQKVQIDKDEYLINHSVKEYCHKILITNFVHLWFEEIEENNLLVRCKEMNKHIEASHDILLDHVVSLVMGKRDNIVRMFIPSTCVDVKTLNLQTSLEGFKFKIKFLLTEASPMQFYEDVTLQFLVTMAELEKRYNLLVDVVEKKDLEIMEYKLEGGRISRKAVETDPFDPQAFSEKCGKSVSATKCQVTDRPSDTLTPLVQDLLDKLSSAPVSECTNKQPEEASKKNEFMKTVMKIKSPVKNKKQKMYDDDDEDEAVQTEEKKTKMVEEKDIEVKKDEETALKPHKGKSKTKKLNL